MTYPGIEYAKSAAAADPDRLAVEARRKEREQEFADWVAVQDIPWGAVNANFAGEEVAKSTVEEYHWDELGYVAKRNSAEGRAVLERTGKATTAERERWAAEDKKASAPAGKKGEVA